MEPYFVIHHSCTEIKRPPIFFKVREYFEKFILENVLSKNDIVVGGSWKIHLAIHFSVKGPKVLFEKIGLGKGGRTVVNEKIKIYDVIILMEPILTSDKPFLQTIELIYEAIKVFFTTTYKKITVDYMNALWSQVDLDYLLSLPYPAPEADQKYVGDMLLPDGSVKRQEW